MGRVKVERMRTSLGSGPELGSLISDLIGREHVQHLRDRVVILVLGNQGIASSAKYQYSFLGDQFLEEH